MFRRKNRKKHRQQHQQQQQHHQQHLQQQRYTEDGNSPPPLSPLSIPVELENITPFVRQAEELDRLIDIGRRSTSFDNNSNNINAQYGGEEDNNIRCVAYFCRQYAVNQGLGMRLSSQAANDCFDRLFYILEKKEEEEILWWLSSDHRDIAESICRSHAYRLFDIADEEYGKLLEDKNEGDTPVLDEERSTKCAKKFKSAATCLQILEQFYEDHHPLAKTRKEVVQLDRERIMHAMSKETEIHDSIRRQVRRRRSQQEQKQQQQRQLEEPEPQIVTRHHQQQPMPWTQQGGDDDPFVTPSHGRHPDDGSSSDGGSWDEGKQHQVPITTITTTTMDDISNRSGTSTTASSSKTANEEETGSDSQGEEEEVKSEDSEEKERGNEKQPKRGEKENPAALTTGTGETSRRRRRLSSIGEDVLSQLKNKTKTSVFLNDDLGVDGAIRLATCLSGNDVVTNLDLDNNDIGAEGIAALVQLLTTASGMSTTTPTTTRTAIKNRSMTKLTTLRIRANNIGNDGAKHMADAISQQDFAIKVLDLFNNKIGTIGIVSIAKAMKIGSGTLTHLHLEGNSVDDDGVTAIADSLMDPKTKTNSLVELYLGYNRIGPNGASALGEALQRNIRLQILHLDHNPIGQEGASSIARSLESNSNLKTLDLFGCGIGDAGADAFAQSLIKKKNHQLSLNDLNLHSNQIGVVGATALAEALKVNTVLTNLGLEDNLLGFDGVKAIAESLRYSLSLKVLKLGKNLINDDAARALANALEVNNSLDVLDLCDGEIGDEGAEALITSASTMAKKSKREDGSGPGRSIRIMLLGNLLSEETTKKLNNPTEEPATLTSKSKQQDSLIPGTMNTKDLVVTANFETEFRELFDSVKYMEANHVGNQTTNMLISQYRGAILSVVAKESHTMTEEDEVRAIMESPQHSEFYHHLRLKLRGMVLACETLTSEMVAFKETDLLGYAQKFVQTGFRQAVTCQAVADAAMAGLIGSSGLASLLNSLGTLISTREEKIAVARVAYFAAMALIEEGRDGASVVLERTARLIVRARCQAPKLHSGSNQFGRWKKRFIDLLGIREDTPQKERAKRIAESILETLMKPDEDSDLGRALNTMKTTTTAAAAAVTATTTTATVTMGKPLQQRQKNGINDGRPRLHEALAAAALDCTVEDVRCLPPVKDDISKGMSTTTTGKVNTSKLPLVGKANGYKGTESQVVNGQESNEVKHDKKVIDNAFKNPTSEGAMKNAGDRELALKAEVSMLKEWMREKDEEISRMKEDIGLLQRQLINQQNNPTGNRNPGVDNNGQATNTSRSSDGGSGAGATAAAGVGGGGQILVFADAMDEPNADAMDEPKAKDVLEILMKRDAENTSRIGYLENLVASIKEELNNSKNK